MSINTRRALSNLKKHVKDIHALDEDLNDLETITFQLGDNKGIKVDTQSPTWTWQDLIGNITVGDKKNASPPAFNIYNDTGGADMRAFEFDLGHTVYNEFHVTHDYVPASDLYVHVHWSVKDADVTGSVTWGFDILYAKGHGQGGAFDTVYSTEVTQAVGAQYEHLIAETEVTDDGTSLIDRSLVEPDALLVVKTYLKASTLSTGKPFGHFVDIHYQSTGIGTKNKAPDFYM